MKFPSHFNCDGKIASEMGPRCYVITYIAGFRLLNRKLISPSAAYMRQWIWSVFGSNTFDGLSPIRRQAII